MDAPLNPAQDESRALRKITRQNYTLRALRTVWSEAPALLFAALLFNLACLPAALAAAAGLWRVAGVLTVVFVAPAWLAMLAWIHAAVNANATAGRDPLPVGERPAAGYFFRCFARFYRRAFVLGAVLYLAGWGLVVSAPAAGAGFAAAQGVGLVRALAAGFVFLYAAVLALYAFPLTAVHDVTLRAAARNAVVLSSRYILPTISLILLIVMCGLLVVFVSSGLLFFLPTLVAVFALFTTYMVVAEETGKQERRPPGERGE